MQYFRPGSLYVLLLFVLVAGPGCNEKHPMAGRYLETELTIPGAYSAIELNSNGTGIWETDLDAVHIKWKIRGEHLWLYIESGASIAGKITDSGFDIFLPGLDTLVFIKQNN